MHDAALTAAGLAFEKQKHNKGAPSGPAYLTHAEAAPTSWPRDPSPRQVGDDTLKREGLLAGRPSEGGLPRSGPPASTYGRPRVGMSNNAAPSPLLAATLAASRSASTSPDRRQPAVTHPRSAEAQVNARSDRGRSYDREPRDLAQGLTVRLATPALGSRPKLQGRGSLHVPSPLLPGRGVFGVQRHRSGDSGPGEARLSSIPASARAAQVSATRPTSLPPHRNQAAPPPRVDSAVSSLASAMVAGSLASARHRLAASATGSSIGEYPSSHGSQDSPHGPPPRPTAILRTLRPQPTADDEDVLRQRQKHNRPLANSRHRHQEGARRRWKDEVSARERRRYEAVWASNRGLLAVGGADGREHVVNVVVRDLWNRSRLPADDLAEVWDLVDADGSGRLGKTEFVVGSMQLWVSSSCIRDDVGEGRRVSCSRPIHPPFEPFPF